MLIWGLLYKSIQFFFLIEKRLKKRGKRGCLFYSAIQFKKKIEWDTPQKSSTHKRAIHSFISLHTSNYQPTTKMTSDTKKMLLELAALKARIDILEAERDTVKPAKKARKTKKEVDPDAPVKPKGEANVWCKFTSRVSTVLKENDAKLPGAEQKQFCSALKAKNDKYDEWDDDAILAESKTWVKPDVSKQEALGKNKTSRSSSTASKTSAAAAAAAASVPPPTLEVVAEVAAAPKKARGRPKKVADAVAPAAAAPVLVIPSAAASSFSIEDDEFEVSPFTLDGKEYFKSCDGDIFDSDSMEYLGILRGKKIVPCPASDAVTAFLAKSQ